MYKKEVQTPAMGITTYYNWYLFNKENWKLVVDNGAGNMFSAKPFPEEGTKFNFNTYYGVNLQFKLNNNKYLTLGTRNMHISNAFLFGDNTNPAIDSIGFLVGIRF